MRALKGGIGILTVFMFGIAIVVLAYVPMPQENREMLMALLGVLGSNVTTIVNSLYPTSSARPSRSTDP